MKRTPPPDLLELVATFGGYSSIPADAWREYDRRVTAWRAKVRYGDDYQPEQTQMDISGQLGSNVFLKPDNFEGPRRAVIADVRPGKFEKPDMEFQDGSILGLNATNLRALANAWSTETDLWIGKEVELYIGQTQFNNTTRDSILVRPISPPIPMAERPKPKPQAKPAPGRGDMDDEIPF